MAVVTFEGIVEATRDTVARLPRAQYDRNPHS